MPVVQMAQFLLERLGELALKTGVLPESPGLDVVAAGAQEQAQTTSVASDAAKPGTSSTG